MTHFRKIWTGFWSAGGLLLALALTNPQWHADFLASAGILIMLAACAIVGGGFGFLLLSIVPRHRHRK